MPENLKRIGKSFVLSDSGVNCYGYRLLTSGYLADKYQRNPIGYFMHQRDGGVLLRWENIRIEGDNIVGDPVINLSHPRGQQTVDEIESGFLNAASMGRVVPLEWSDDQALMMEGQTGLTITKWYNKECSLVDIPGNDNALAELYDENDNPLNLSDFSTINIEKMKEVKLPITADLIKALNLSDNPDPAAVQKAINDLADKAKQADQLQADKTKLEGEKKTLEQRVQDLQDASVTKEVKDLLDNAQEAGKITQKTYDQLKGKYEKDPQGLKDLLDGLPASSSVTDQISKEKEDKAKKTKSLEDLSWDDIDKQGKLADLKANNRPLYDQKFEERFGKKPNA